MFTLSCVHSEESIYPRYGEKYTSPRPPSPLHTHIWVGLFAGTEYQFRLRAFINGSWQAREESIVSSPFRTVCAPPDPPANCPSFRQLESDPLVVGRRQDTGALLARERRRLSDGSSLRRPSNDRDSGGPDNSGDRRSLCGGGLPPLPVAEQEKGDDGEGTLVTGKHEKENNMQASSSGVAAAAAASTSIVLEWETGCPNGAIVTSYEVSATTRSPQHAPETHVPQVSLDIWGFSLGALCAL